MRISDTDHILYLLGRVGAEYNSFVVTMTTRPADISLEQVHIMLLTHENR